jgi:hypothetical protein
MKAVRDAMELGTLTALVAKTRRSLAPAGADAAKAP